MEFFTWRAMTRRFCQKNPFVKQSLEFTRMARRKAGPICHTTRRKSSSVNDCRLVTAYAVNNKIMAWYLSSMSPSFPCSFCKVLLSFCSLPKNTRLTTGSLVSETRNYKRWYWVVRRTSADWSDIILIAMPRQVTRMSTALVLTRSPKSIRTIFCTVTL